MWEIQNLYKKLNQLPEPVKSYATSLKAAEINSELFNLFQVEPSKWSALTILIAGIIVKEIELFDLEKKLATFLAWDEKKALNFAIEIVGSRLLVCDDWLEGAAERYLKQQQVDPSRFASLVAEQQLAVEKEKEFFAEQLREPEDTSDWAGNDFNDVLSEDEDEFDDESLEDNGAIISDEELEDKRKELIDTLKSNLLSLLNSEDEEELADFNYFLTYIWNKDETFSQEVMQNLLANKEKISGASLLIEEKEQPATISILLKQFIKKYGLVANDLNIAEFLSSTVTKYLADREKVIALRILKFYNNLNKIDNYLQAGIDGVPNNFEIFPAKTLMRSNNQTRVKTKPSSDWDKLEPAALKEIDKKRLAEAEQKQRQQAADILEPKVSSLAQELELMLQDYPADSLERRTIMQEIKRLRKSEENNE